MDILLDIQDNKQQYCISHSLQKKRQKIADFYELKKKQTRSEKKSEQSTSQQNQVSECRSNKMYQNMSDSSSASNVKNNNMMIYKVCMEDSDFGKDVDRMGQPISMHNIKNSKISIQNYKFNPFQKKCQVDRQTVKKNVNVLFKKQYLKIRDLELKNNLEQFNCKVNKNRAKNRNESSNEKKMKKYEIKVSNGGNERTGLELVYLNDQIDSLKKREL